MFRNGLGTSILVLMACVTVASGCTTKPIIRDYSDSEYSRVESKEVVGYKIGHQTRAFVGQPVLMRRTEKVAVFPQHIAVTDKAFAYEIGWRDIEIEPEKKYPIRGKTTVEDVEYYVVMVPGAEGQTYGFLVTENGQISKHVINLGYMEPSAWMLLSGVAGTVGAQMAAGVLMLGTFELKPETATLTPMVVRKSLADLPGEKAGAGFELVYYGMDHDQLRFGYRELRGDDPIINQELTYEVSDPKIRFQDFEIKVHEATRDHIDFTVVSD